MLLVAGSLTLDRIYRCAKLPEDGGTVGGAATLHIGGLGGIEALAALRSGAKVEIAAAIGEDDDARILRGLLVRHGLNATLSICHDAPTGSSATLLDDMGRYWRVDALAANTLFETGPDIERLMEKARLLLCQCDTNSRTTHKLMTLARKRQIRTILHAMPPRLEVLKTLVPMADLIVTSCEGFSEMARLFPPSGFGDFTGEQIHALSDIRLGELCRSVVKTDLIIMMGGRGAFLSERDGQSKLISDSNNSLSRTSFCCADETFVGALCARILDGDNLRQSIRYALTAAAMPGPMGGQDAIPKWADVLTRIEHN